MKYADRVIELMAAYPGRDFRMIEIVRYINPTPANGERHALRIGVARVLNALARDGFVLVRPPRVQRGGFGLYRWAK